MSAIGPNYAQHQGVSAVSGSWVSPTNAEGAGTGTYTTWTSTTSSASATLELMAYNVNLPTGAVLDSLLVECQHKESSTTVISGLTGQFFTTSNILDANTANFESTLGAWGGGDPQTLDATHVNSGVQAAKCVGTNFSTSGTFPAGGVTVGAGVACNAGLFVYTTAAAQTATLSIKFINSSGSLISTSNGASTTLTQNGWTYVQLGPASPAGTVSANLVLAFGASGTFWIDTVSFGTPAAVGSPTTFTRATTDTISSITSVSGINAADVGNIRLRVVASHNATTTSGVESIDFARVTATYHISEAVLPGNQFGEADQSVEFGTLNWVAGTNTSSAVRSNTQAYDGEQSVKMISTASGAMGLVWNSTKLAVTAGTNYTFACRVWSSVSTTCNLEIDFYNGASFVGFTDLTGALVSLVSGWNTVTLSGVATATANGAVPIVIPIATTGVQAFYADQFFFGLGPTLVGAADTGAGVDSATVKASVPGADVGAGVDAAALVASIPVADTGVGVDAASVKAAIPAADLGAGVDAAALVAAIPGADTGAAVDAAAVTASVPVADVVVGVDAAKIALTGADTGTGVDAGTVLAGIPAADTGVGVDSASVLIAAADTGSGSDSAVAGTTIGAADTGAFADTATVVASIPAPDQGAWVDSATTAATIPASDTGTGVDVGAQGSFVPAGDTGTGLDAASLRLAAADTGTGADTAGVTALLPATDTAVGVDAASIRIASSDTGTGVDAAAVKASIPASDAGVGADSAGTTAIIPAADTGTGADVAGLARTIVAADTGSFTDSATFSVFGPPSGFRVVRIDPESRVTQVAAEVRRLIVDPESRLTIIGADNRRLIIPVESRVYTVTG